MTRPAYICAGKRTPIGRYGGALAEVRPDDLAAHVIRAVIDGRGIEPDEVVLGCANQAGEDNRNVARMAALLADLPETVPGDHAQPTLRQRHGRDRSTPRAPSRPAPPTCWWRAAWRA